MALFNAESKRGWVMKKDYEWLECEVVDSAEAFLSLKIEGGSPKTFQRKDIQFFYRNPTAVEKSPNFLTLPNLDEPNILHSLRCRYWAKEVYSYTGDILIAVNPWERRDIYAPQLLQSYRSGSASGPHIFDIASKALKKLHDSRKSQCVLISGESGSGKTENTKYVLQVLTSLPCGGGTSGGSTSTNIEQQVMLTNPVLEAFGNAKTLRNDNSSRFGKWISVDFESRGKVRGAQIRTYLLEKARVVGQGEGERNYHIFYQVCECAAGSSMMSGLGIGPASSYKIVSTTLKANNTDDRADFEATKQAMDYIGFDAKCQKDLFSGLSAILSMGNFEFGEDKSGHAVLEIDAVVDHASRMLGVDPAGLAKAVCMRKITVGGDVLEKPENKEKVGNAPPLEGAVLPPLGPRHHRTCRVCCTMACSIAPTTFVFHARQDFEQPLSQCRVGSHWPEID